MDLRFISYVQGQQGFGPVCIESRPVQRQRPYFLSLSVQQCDVSVCWRGHIRAGQWSHRGRGHRGKAWDGHNKTVWLVAWSSTVKCNFHHMNILTRRFDDIMWPGTRNLPAVLVHTPAVSGLSITLDRTKRQFTSNLSLKLFQLLVLLRVRVVCTWIVHLVHTEAGTVVALVFHHSAQSN